jgi:hypothetical protein
VIESYDFRIYMKMVLPTKLCQSGYKRYTPKLINAKNFKLSEGKAFCAEMRRQYLSFVKNAPSIFNFKKAFPVELSEFDDDIIADQCGGWYINNKQEGHVGYVFEKVIKKNKPYYYCNAKEKWYIDVEKDDAVKFFDEFGSPTVEDGVEGYIMNYRNPEYEGIKISEADGSTSYLFQNINNKPEECPNTCQKLLNKCYCSEVTLNIIMLPKNICPQKLCELFGKVEKVERIRKPKKAENLGKLKKVEDKKRADVEGETKKPKINAKKVEKESEVIHKCGMVSFNKQHVLIFQNRKSFNFNLKVTSLNENIKMNDRVSGEWEIIKNDQEQERQQFIFIGPMGRKYLVTWSEEETNKSNYLEKQN